MKFDRKTVTIIVAIGVGGFLLANAGARKIYQRYWELRTLNAALEQSKRENALLRKEVHFLKNDPTYIEKMARRELGVVSQGEVEYRFNK